MWEIRNYKQLLTVELKDGTKLNTEKDKEKLQEAVAQSDFVQLDWILVNKYEIKKAYYRSITTIEEYILTLDKDLQAAARKREKEKKRKVWKWFDSIEEVSNYLQRNWYI